MLFLAGAVLNRVLCIGFYILGSWVLLGLSAHCRVVHIRKILCFVLSGSAKVSVYSETGHFLMFLGAVRSL